MRGMTVGGDYKARLESMERAVNEAAGSLKAMAAVVILGVIALVLIMAGK